MKITHVRIRGRVKLKAELTCVNVLLDMKVLTANTNVRFRDGRGLPLQDTLIPTLLLTTKDNIDD